MNMLDVLTPPLEDESITKLEERNYGPYNINALGKNEEIRIAVLNSEFVLPCESYLYLEGEVTNITPATVEKVTLAKNFAMSLFNEIRFELNGIVVDSIRQPGIATTMKNLVAIGTRELVKTSEFWWTTRLELQKDQAKFSLCIPMRHILPFFEDYKKIIICSKLELVLVRSKSDVNCFIDSTPSSSANIQLTKCQWKMPHVCVDDLIKLKLMKILENGREVSVSFRRGEFYEYPNARESTNISWQIKNTCGVQRPVAAIVGMQTGKKDVLAADIHTFNTNKLTNAKLYLNDRHFPYEDLNIKFTEDQYATLYKMFANFRKTYYNQDDTCITFTEYKNSYPLIVFDTTYMEPSIKNSTVDVRLELSFEANLPKNTNIYILILYDYTFTYLPLSGVVLNK